MGAGKSVALLSVAHNYDRIGQSTVVFTAAVDDRFGVGKVASRLGISRDAKTFNKDTTFGLALTGNNVACVLVDESQFLTREQVMQLHKIAAINDVPVICFGLRTDFLGLGFEGAYALGVLADEITELKTVCRCGKRASFNMRINAQGDRVHEGNQIEIGGDDAYRQTCPACFYQ
jgi:thymidine kinase